MRDRLSALQEERTLPHRRIGREDLLGPEDLAQDRVVHRPGGRPCTERSRTPRRIPGHSAWASAASSRRRCSSRSVPPCQAELDCAGAGQGAGAAPAPRASSDDPRSRDERLPARKTASARNRSPPDSKTSSSRSRGSATGVDRRSGPPRLILRRLPARPITRTAQPGALSEHCDRVQRRPGAADDPQWRCHE
jgi:hypothetical protein